MTRGERTGLIVLGIILAVIVAIGSLSRGRENASTNTVTETVPSNAVTETATTTFDTVNLKPDLTYKKEAKKKLKAKRPEPERRNPRSERLN